MEAVSIGFNEIHIVQDGFLQEVTFNLFCIIVLMHVTFEYLIAVLDNADIYNVVVKHLLNTQPIVVHSLEYHLISGGIDSYVAMLALAVLEHYCVTFQHFSQSLDSCLWQWLLFNFLQVFIIDFF